MRDFQSLRNGGVGSMHGSFPNRSHWFYRRVRDSTPVAVCTALGCRYPQGQTRSKARTPISSKKGKEGLTKLVQIRLTSSRRCKL